ncbi:collagen-like triple helix repeat-containing protein [Chitinophaga silvisoli]|uniref:Collagen-like protein n=1 Tax=Chitinophaga silvisoli TaxID=2291814 RepID=A0A3E1P6J6_9BACT|nr:collagen-like protein [Chitinophaga silvisoli]RFM35638.1 collagen-like protein [Chitinophaga silvisoli]
MKRIFCSVNASLLLLAVALCMFSCGKDGKTGPQGDPGPTGPAGPTGPKGDAGTANVIYSDWLTVAFLPDTIHNTDGTIDTIGFYADIDIAKLDATLISTGEMKVYLNLNTPDDPVVTPLPYTNIYSGWNILATFFTGGVELYANGDAGTWTDGNSKLRWQYRYVLVPGGTEARKAKTVDMSDYKQVKAWLGLKD